MTSTAPHTVSDALAAVALRRSRAFFGLMGNGNVHFLSAITSSGGDFISSRHENGAVAMADAYSRAGGGIATVSVTYSSGFANAITALGEARKARSPMVLVVGDAPQTGRRGIDIDQRAVAGSLDVPFVSVNTSTAEAAAEWAYDAAERHRVPVIVAIPYDLVDATVAANAERPVVSEPVLMVREREEHGEPTDDDVQRVVELLRGAKCPLILGGRGVVLAAAAADLRTAGDALGALFAETLMSRNVFESPWSVGIAGGFSSLPAANLLRSADVVLAVGASLNLYQMRYGTIFAGAEHLIQVDVLDEATHPDVTRYLRADAAKFSSAFSRIVQEGGRGASTWRADVEVPAGAVFTRDDAYDQVPQTDGLDPRAVMQRLERILPHDKTVVQDTGHCMGWAPSMWSYPDPGSLLSPGLAIHSIGLGLPSAVGAHRARPERPVVLVSGDGGAMMALPEFDTLIRTAQSALIIVLNDSSYSMEVHQYAVRGLDDTAMMFPPVDFAALGRAFGVDGVRVQSMDDLGRVEDWIEAGARGVMVVDVPVSLKYVGDWVRESNAYNAANR
ncbi:thiamine pyrophosphate-binding protein [Microbacterium hibisci]|uniref:thiamine pyrophosphate-binding protein n=1 Tax=Microbacterium hibisci TaxID=2036000 RepID=UPI001945B92A|nr:thiamine pyrophosphate-dependent enzyme [Microbacterium hibisci]